MTEIKPDLSGEGLRVGIVRSRFNERIGAAMLDACGKRLAELRVALPTVVSVPGALEAPLALQKLANTEKYDALIALGAVIRGETYHFEVVANESASGLMQVRFGFRGRSHGIRNASGNWWRKSCRPTAGARRNPHF